MPKFFSSFLQNNSQMGSWINLSKRIKKFCFGGYSFLHFTHVISHAQQSNAWNYVVFYDIPWPVLMYNQLTHLEKWCL